MRSAGARSPDVLHVHKILPKPYGAQLERSTQAQPDGKQHLLAKGGVTMRELAHHVMQNTGRRKRCQQMSSFARRGVERLWCGVLTP